MQHFFREARHLRGLQGEAAIMGRRPTGLFLVALWVCHGCAGVHRADDACIQTHTRALSASADQSQAPADSARQIGCTREPRSNDRAITANDRLNLVSASAAPSVVHIRTILSPKHTAHSYNGRCTATTLAAGAGKLIGGGSGVVVGPRGLILTSAHVVDDALQVDAYAYDGRRRTIKHVWLVRGTDLAILEPEAGDLRPLPAFDPLVASRDSSAIVAPKAIVALAAPRGMPVCSVGLIVKADANLQSELDSPAPRNYASLIEATAAVEPGCSGGPLLSDDGRLLGIIVAAATRSGAPRTYAIPVDDALCALIARIQAADAAPPPYADR